MYAFKRAAMNDNIDTFPHVFGTVFLKNRIYVLDRDADYRLLHALRIRYYRIEAADMSGYAARRVACSLRERFDVQNRMRGDVAFSPEVLTVNLRYADGRRHSLVEPDIHETILKAADVTPVLSWHEGIKHSLSEQNLSDMGAFATAMIEGVTPDMWRQFSEIARHIPRADAIKGLAFWASVHSDGEDRAVRSAVGANEVVIVRARRVSMPEAFSGGLNI